MKLVIWSLHDKRAGIFQEPMTYRTDDVAKIQMRRSLMQDIENGNIVKSLLSEFEFVKLAEFDDRSGVYEPIPVLEREVMPMEISDDQV